MIINVKTKANPWFALTSYTVIFFPKIYSRKIRLFNQGTHSQDMSDANMGILP